MKKIIDWLSLNVFWKQRLKKCVLKDFEQKLKPDFFVYEIGLFTARRRRHLVTVYIEVVGNIDMGFTCGRIIYNLITMKRQSGKLTREDECCYDKSIIDEAEEFLK